MISKLKSLFLLKEDITFLNFGSFGASPIPVFEEYQRLQLELEREPIQFIIFRSGEMFTNARIELAKYINCHQDDLVFVMNPSYATNIVAKNLNLKPGDEILTTDLEYGACDRAMDYYCNKAGATLKRQKVTLPLVSKETFVEDFMSGITSKTKMIFISHITSSTALIFPIKEICTIAKEKGILTFVDGAHVPGHIDLDLEALGVDIYTGACHKWMMAPKGCSFFYVKKEYQHMFDPLLISWGYNAAKPSHSKFLDYHQMQGTRDLSPFFALPKCIEFMEKYNWKEVSNNCKKLVRNNAIRFCELMNTTPLASLTEELIGQMLSIEINTNEPEELQKTLYQKYKIEIPVMPHADKVYLRYSINGFNNQEDLDKLYEALIDIKKSTTLLK
jgi:isopenicillin-N epimerase